MHKIKLINSSDNKGRSNATLKVLSFKNQKIKQYDETCLQQMINDNQHLIKSIQTNGNMSATTSNFNTPINNTFIDLVDDEGDGIEFNFEEQPKNKNVKVVIPPIIIQNLTNTQIKDIFKNLNIKNFLIKLCSIGLKVTLNELSDYKKLQQHLVNQKVEHFTYRSPSDKLLKVILNGLPKGTDIDEIKQSLTDNEYTSKDIKIEDILEVTELIPKKGSLHNGLYLLKFNANNTKLKTLQKIKSINHVIISFRIHIPKRTSPTQCRRCGMYGHGTSFCSKTLRCLKCGEPHESVNCKVPDANLKCCLCTGNHAANSPDCPKLKEYVLIQENVKIRKHLRTTNSTTTRNTSNQRPPNLFNADKFPALSSPRQTQMHQMWNTTFNTNQPKPTHINRPNEESNRAEQRSAHDLFTYEEILSLVSDMVSSLSGCKTKYEQFEVLTRLTVTYLYGNVPK